MEKLLVEFARHSDRQKVDLHFVSLGARGTVADDIEACDWPVAVLEEPPGLRPGLVMRLARLFRRWGIQVVHTHNTKPLIYAAFAARLAGVARVIHTRHGQRFQATAHETLLFRLAGSLAERVVCVSHDGARLSAAEGLAPRRICTIWNGIDVRRFAFVGPEPAGPVVMVGRLSPEKDVETLIRATALAVREYPAFRLEVAGDGPCGPGLRRLADDLGVSAQVRFLGEVRDVPALLARASLFVLPSLTEGISLTLLEAMARGLPVVTTRVGGNPEVVADGVTGLLVPARSAPELAGAMLRVLRCPAEGQRLGSTGRRRVEQYFDVRRMVADYETHYLAGREEHRRRAQGAEAVPA
jgi:glycosyltransferase involved in cell wall biosynthesis